MQKDERPNAFPPTAERPQRDSDAVMVTLLAGAGLLTVGWVGLIGWGGLKLVAALVG